MRLWPPLRLAAAHVATGCGPRLRRALPSLIVLAGLAAWWLPIAGGRLIDGDEGYLLMAARLLGEGRWPYHDFFLTQAPLAPATFALVFGVFGRGWMVARLFSGLLAVAMGWLVYRESLAATRRPSAAVFATAVFVLSGEAIGWLAIVKGYGLTALCLLACVRGLGAVVRHEVLAPAAHPARGGLLAAGILAGLAASTRLYTLLVMPALAVYLVVKLGRGRATVRGLGRYAVGGLLGLVPLLVCCLRAPRAFLFDTLLYHAVREYGQDSLLGSASAKLPVILETMGLDAQATYGERQWLALAVAALLALLARARARDTPPSPAGVVALVLVAASLLPNPFLPQYLCLAVPLLAIEAGRLLGTLLDRVRARPRWSAVVAAAAVGYLVYNGWVGWHDRCRFLHTGVDVPGVESTDRMPRWEIATVEAVAKVIDAQHIPVGASWWPGYFVGAQTGIVVELANDFGFRAASALPPAERRRLHVVDHAGVAEMIKQRQPRLFVEGNWANYPVAALLPHYGYRLRATVKNVHVWTAE